MADAALGFTFKNPGAELARSIRNAMVGDTVVQCASDAGTEDPLGVDGWVTMGVSSGVPKINGNLEKFLTMSGSPVTNKGAIKVGMSEDAAFEFTHVSYECLKLAYGNEIATTETVASDGQDTVASSTDQYTTVVTTGTNLAAGDLIIVGNTIKELVILSSFVTATKVAKHTKLSQTPSASTTFLKVKGPTLSAAGIKFTRGGDTMPTRKWRIVRFLNAQMMYIQYIIQGTVTSTSGFAFDPKAPLKVSFGIDAVDQSSATSGPLFGYDWLIPLES